MISKLFVILVNILVLIILSASIDVTLRDGRPVFDASLFEDALDSELCQRQLEEMRNNTKLWLQFVESGLGIPRSISIGNTVDLGNYPQCIGINEEINNTPIEGKYCYLSVPVDQDVDFPLLPDWSERTASLKGSNTVLRLVVCVPKACTVREGIVGLLRNATTFEFQYNELSCRFANDKLLAPVDYIAYVVFFLLGLITILSTGYDIYHTIYLKADPKEISTLYRSFSIYTNINQITTFTKSRGALECVDGIRSIAMMWIMLYHSFETLRIPSIINRDEARNWLYSRQSIWVTTATLSVDTFYMISGMLVVYTSVNKYTGMTLLKNLHMFYLNRILRIFPLLAASVLIQVSFLNHISDGPNWNAVISQTEVCRRQWWVTLLFLQNIINPSDVCLPHSWYLAVDMHMHIICPVVLFFVLGRRKNVAWSALIISLLVVLTFTAIYVFLMGSDIFINSTSEEHRRYNRYYYRNTLARASPFFVGMIIGYILHLYRKNKLVISKYIALLLWICALSLTTLSWLGMETMKNENWDNPAVNGFVNTFMRPAWAFGVGWIVLACVQGYGGPVNWFLSLQMWKMPSRISYAMYLLHFPLMFVFGGTTISPIYFSIESALYVFWSQFLISYVVAIFATLLIDLPFATLFKLLLGGGARQAPTEKLIETPENKTPENR